MLVKLRPTITSFVSQAWAVGGPTLVAGMGWLVECDTDTLTGCPIKGRPVAERLVLQAALLRHCLPGRVSNGLAS
jgi:hypothetical protein